MHHVLARLIQDEPGAPQDDVTTGGANDAGPLIEWAINKNYDIYRPNTGKLLLPGSKIWWELHMHGVGESIRDHAELGVYFYPKGQEPKYRTRLTLFGATATQGSPLDIRPNSHAESEGFHVLKQAAQTSSLTCTCGARPWRWKPSCPMGRISFELRRPFQFQLATRG
jgi:hypothetical protein